VTPELSICVTVKNRSRVRADGRELTLFPNCVRSIVHAVPPELSCELVVADWESDDWPLAEWLEETARPLPVRLVTPRGPFSRGGGRNVAAQAARAPTLLFLDADVLLCREVVTRGLRIVGEGKAYFPIFYYFLDPEHARGWWWDFGFGQCMVTSAVYQRSGGWPEYFTWGKEDDDFFDRIASVAPVVRERVDGFHHQWHPVDASQQGVVTWIRQARIALDELASVIPPGEVLLLADDGSLAGQEVGARRRVLPFTERGGVSWGPPADDGAAIEELERQRGRGASFFVIPWLAFWWLEWYGDFNRYLRSRFPCVSATDRMIVFDLRERAAAAAHGAP
jgi:hypothetical protein